VQNKQENSQVIRLLVFAALFASFIWACVAVTDVMSARLQLLWIVIA
jgi:hypothetical protein